MSELSLLLSISRRFDKVVRDPVWGDIHFDETLYALTRNPSFLILDGIRQLGPVAIIYPGATHTRRSHSIGVYHLARKLAMSLLERGQIPFATAEGLRAFLVAALLHDIGHFPYAHSLKELPLARHEVLAGASVLKGPLRGAILECGAEPDMVAAIIDRDRTATDRETALYRRILSGVLDPDKIDYLTRDAFHCGVPYGIQDADFIVRRLFVEREELVVDERGEMSVEAVLFSKYQMYRAVYWHSSVRAATAMVRKSVYLGMAEGSIEAEDLYGLDDGAFASLVGSDQSWAGLARDAFSGNLFSAITELAYDASNPIHADLADLDRRHEAEMALASAAGIDERHVVIDIPEPISFETELPVREGGKLQAFSSRSRVFDREHVDGLVASLRKIRIFTHPQADEKSTAGLARELLS